MTRFFAQLLLSVMIGISAAAGFNSNVRGELKETMHSAGVMVQETMQIALESAGDLFAQTNVKVDAAVDTYAEGNANSSSTNAQMTGAGDLNLLASPTLNVDESSSSDSQVNADSETEDANLSLSEKLKSTLGLNFGFGN